MQADNVVDALLEDDLDKRPTVYRAGKLPEKGLPAWFVQLDTDQDGQVALYEWRAAGRDLDEFAEWDRDNDGFITPEEALKVQASLTRSANPLLASNTTPGSTGPGGQRNFGQGGPGGQRNFGQGGPGGGGKGWGGNMGGGGGKGWGGGNTDGGGGKKGGGGGKKGGGGAGGKGFGGG